MSSENTGAASAAPSIAIPEDATPAQIDQWEQAAYDAIENVQDPDAAEALLGQVTVAAQAIRLARVSEEREQRWGGLRLRAERRYGELLGPAKRDHSRLGVEHTLSDSEKEGRKQARKVAAVPEDEFEDYIKNEPKPSRTGLLRKTSPPPRERKRSKNTTPAEATQRLRERVREVRTKNARVRPRWTLEDTDDVQALIASKRQPRESGKRLRQLHAERRNGRAGDLWHLQKAIAEAVSALEYFELPELDWSEETETLILEIHDDLVRHARWNDEAIDGVTAHMDDLGRRRKIHALRARAEDPSSTQSERETASRLANRLEQKRNAKPLAG